MESKSNVHSTKAWRRPNGFEGHLEISHVIAVYEKCHSPRLHVMIQSGPVALVCFVRSKLGANHLLACTVQ